MPYQIYQEIHKAIQDKADFEYKKFMKIGPIANQQEFEDIIKGIVNYRWMRQFPTHFYNLYFNEYTQHPSGYSALQIPVGYFVYTTIKNTHFDHVTYHTSTKDMDDLIAEKGKLSGSVAYQERLIKVINDAKSSDNIMMWAINHFIIC